MIKQATWTDIERVAKAMRADHRSACAVAGTDDPVTAIQVLSALRFVGVTIWKDDEPIIACGAVFLHRGVASSFMYATDRWPEVATEAREFLGHTAKRILTTAGIHRLQILGMTGDPLVDLWRQASGAERESVLAKYGKNGEDFDLFVCHLQAPVALAS
ncbi:MAG: hypothetical protein WBD95_22630 [Xanthobacteraceae bacterium]